MVIWIETIYWNDQNIETNFLYKKNICKKKKNNL